MAVASRTEMGREELRKQLTEEAARLRSLAASVRARSQKPELAQYISSCRGPTYQRDYETWLRNAHAAGAFDEAASRLEQMLASSLL